LLPVVLVYQTWTYYVFRRRVTQQQFQPSPQRSTPLGPPTATPDGAAPPAGKLTEKCPGWGCESVYHPSRVIATAAAGGDRGE
jgi:hypothetical protein